MAKTQQVRRLQNASGPDFDDQAWLVNCALLVLAGSIVGVVVAMSDFADPRLLYNGYVRLVSVGVIVAGLFAAIHWLEGRMLRRVQFCILISLLAHFWLDVFLYNTYMIARGEDEKRKELLVEDPAERITVPDYHEPDQPTSEVKSPYEEPVNTPAPKDRDPEPAEKKATDQEIPFEPQKPLEVETPALEQPSPADLRRQQLAAPHRDTAGGRQISRQPMKHQPQPDEPIVQPEAAPAGKPLTVPLTPQEAAIARQQPQTRTPQQRTFEAPAAEQKQDPVQIARRGSEPTTREAPATPEPIKRITTVADMVRTEAQPDAARIAQATNAPNLQPAAQEAAQRAAELPRVAPKTPQTPASEATVDTKPTTPRRATETQAALAQAAAALRRTQPPVVPQPTEAALEATPAAQSVSQALASASAEVARQAAAAPRTSNPASPLAPAAEVGGAVAVNQPQRAEAPIAAPRDTPPTATPSRKTAVPSDLPAAIAEAAAPAARISQPTLALSQPGAATVERQAPSAAPAAAAKTAGPAVAPLSATENLPALSSRRAAASQQTAPGAAEAASVAQTLHRQATGVAIPSATVPLESIAPATPGAAFASKLEASTQTGAVERGSASAPSGKALAAAGAAETAIGASSTPARMGAPRGRGDREPSTQASGAALRPARNVAGAALGALAAAEPGAAPSPIASPGSGPTAAPGLSATATAAARSGRAVLPATKPTPGSGAVGPSGTAGAIGAAELSRVARQEADAAAVSGGGTPKPAKATSRPALPLDGPGEAIATAATAPGAGRDAGSPLEPNVGGQQRQAAGLAGRQITVPAAGSLSLTTSQGSPLPQTVARRAEAAQPSGAGDAPNPDRTATLARAKIGIELPSVALVADEAATAGQGGAAPAAGGQPSRLEEGAVAGVARAASSAPMGKATAAASYEPLAMGVAEAPALPGRPRAVTDEVATLGGVSAAAKPGRTASAATFGGSIETAVAPAASPASEPAAEGTQTELAASGAAAAVARAATGRMTSGAGPAGGDAQIPAGAEQTGALALNRATTGPVAAAMPSAAPAAGPARRQGRGAADIEVAVAQAEGEAPTAGKPAEGATGAIEVTAVDAVRQATGTQSVAGHRAAVNAGGEPGPAASTPELVAGPRRLAKGDAAAAIAAEIGGGPVRKTNRPGLARGMLDEVELQPVAAGEASDAPAGNELAMADGLGEVRRREGGLPVQVAAPLGPGGVSLDPAPRIGVPNRRARPESELVHNAAGRFAIERTGGVLAIDGALNVPMETFAHRDIGRRGEAVRARGGSEGTERAVEMGLDFFARMQFPDGHWSIHKLPPGVNGDDPALGQMESDAAATGLALLTYLGGGYTHTDDKHRDIVRKGLDWLVKNQKTNGDLFTGGTNYAWFYSHGMATMALCEGYGMTQDPQLREPARKAVQFILESQHPKRGGWRYAPQAESDTSVSGWQLQALKSAQMAGIDVPPEAFRRIGGWLDQAQAPGGKYVYNPFADRARAEQAEGLRPSLAMTGEGMLMRMYMGHSRDNRRLIEGANWLKGNLPQLGSADRPQRDCYYWYYGTQAMFQMQGEYWPDWNERMRQAIEPTQFQVGEWSGSWHPDKPVRDRWGHAGGRVYVTAMHLLMLEVYYRVLPLYQELTK